MSTNSCIILKLRREDIGKVKEFNRKQLPMKLSTWRSTWYDERSRLKCKPVELKGGYIGIYVHWDGSTLGEVLNRNFKDYDSVLNLLLGGSCSYIVDDSVRYYANRKGEFWAYISPYFADSVQEMLNGHGEECNYLFNGNCWNRL